jgi:hypothetical protein
VLLLALFFLPELLFDPAQGTDVKILGISILSPEFRAIVGVGIAFCELMIIVFSSSIVLTIVEAIKLIPLMFFVMAMYKTFWPIVSGLFPTEGAETFSAERGTYLTDVVNNDAFKEGVLLTLVTMLFFVIINQAFGKVKRGRTIKLE